MQSFISPMSTKYPIYIATGLLSTAFFDVNILDHSGDLVFVCDEVLLPLHMRKLLGRLQAQRNIYVLEIAAGEHNKTRENKYKLENKLMHLGLSNNVTLVAVGGGVVLDLVAFVAATYCGGVPCIYIPTTLVAMVDSSVNCMVGVNTPLGKDTVTVNMQPKSVWIDVNFLQSLANDDVCDGLVYMMRLALLCDRELFAKLSLICDTEAELQPAAWAELITDCLHLKMHLLDPKHKPRDKFLLFGSVLGDSLLSCTKYQISSGQALRFGMLLESRISSSMGLLATSKLLYINNCLNSIRYQNHFCFSNVSLDDLMLSLQYSNRDFSTAQKIVLLHDIAQAHMQGADILYPLDKNLLRQCLDNFLQSKVMFI